MSNFFNLEGLPNEIILELELFGVKSSTMMLLNRRFLALFASKFYKRIHCILNVDLEHLDDLHTTFPDMILHLDNDNACNNACQMRPVTKSDAVENVTLIYDSKRLSKFFSNVMTLGSHMREFIERITFDTIIVQGDDPLGMVDSSLLSHNIWLHDPHLSAILERYLSRSEIIERDHPDFMTRTENYVLPSPHQLRFHNDLPDLENRIFSSKQITLFMQLCYNFSSGYRHGNDPFESGCNLFEEVAVKDNEVKKVGRSNRYSISTSHPSRTVPISKNIDTIKSEGITKPAVYALLDDVVKGLVNAPKSCEAEFCSIVVKSKHSSSENSGEIITSQRAKVIGFKLNCDTGPKVTKARVSKL